MLLTGADRIGLKNKLEIIDFKIRNFGMLINPEHKEMLEQTEYLLENNLPIPRDNIYVILPEIFEYEAEDISQIEKRKLAENRLILEIVC